MECHEVGEEKVALFTVNGFREMMAAED